ncbi:MAG TPA: hypothetical protein V6C90_08220 [Coleofasciculaceae cyanobacterium]|jgi:hypothetical protein
MTSASSIKITIALQDPNLDDIERQKETEQLLQQIRNLDEVENADLVRDPNPPEGSKTVSGFLIGLLTAEVNAKNIKALFGFLGERLGNKPIELEVEAYGKKLKIKASSQQELQAVMQAAQDFIVQG